MLLRSIRTVERLRNVTTCSISCYLTSHSSSQRCCNGFRSYLPHRVTTETAFSCHIYSRDENQYTTASAPVSPRRRKAGKGNPDSPAVDAVELALDSVVKIFTVSTSPSYFLPWQNKSQRESMGSGISLESLCFP